MPTKQRHEQEVTVVTQATRQTTGQWWEMLKGLGNKLPKDNEVVAYHGKPGWYHNRLAELVRLEHDSEAARQVERILSHGSFLADADANPYKDEEAQPVLFYPEGYKPNGVDQQTQTLLERLGDWDARCVSEYAQAWDMRYYWQADGLYIFPKPLVQAARLKIDRPYDENWGLLTQEGPIAALKAQRAVKDWLEGKLAPELFRLVDSSRAALEKLAEQQPKGDFFVVPAQTGRLYAGKSPRNASWRIEHATFPAQWRWPAYCTSWGLYTNPHRLDQAEHLCIDCGGDELRFSPDADFGRCPWFSWGVGKLHFFGLWVGNALGPFGSASALS